MTSVKKPEAQRRGGSEYSRNGGKWFINTLRHLFRSGFELVYDQSVRSRLTGSLGRQMEFLEFDSSFVSRRMSLSDQKTPFTIASNSQKSRTRKRCFCHFTAVFEKPNGHVPRGCITYKLFFLKPITCLSITLCFLCT